MNRGRLREDVKRLPRNVWVLTLTSLFTDISSEMILNLIPLFLANVLGVRTGLIGVVEGVAESVASLLAGLLWQGAGSWPGYGAGSPFYVGSVLAVLAAGLFRAFSLGRKPPYNLRIQGREE